MTDLVRNALVGIVTILVLGCGDEEMEPEAGYDDEAIDAMLEEYHAGLEVTFAAGPPPPFLDSAVLGRLTQDADDSYGRPTSYSYGITRDVGEFKDVYIGIHPENGVRFHADAMLKEAETRYLALTADPIGVIKSAPDQLLQLFHKYFPDQPDVAIDDLTTGLELNVILIQCGPVDDMTYDEMGFYGNELYLNFDLRVATDHDGKVILIYFDG